MPTFLVNAKMNPELAARVEASVTGRRQRVRAASAGVARPSGAAAGGGALPHGAARAARTGGTLAARRRRQGSLRLVFRLTALLSILTLGGFLFWNVRRSRLELEAAQAALSARLAAHARELTSDGRKLPALARTWLQREAGGYSGDHVAPELAAPGGLDAALRRSAVYVRGEIEALREPARFEFAVSESAKDALLLCLLAPPRGRDEKALLGQVYVAYDGGPALDDATPKVLRLHDALVGVGLLAGDSQSAIDEASNRPELKVLGAKYEPETLKRGVAAANAKLLIFALDEPKRPGTVTEMDGASDHFVRVGMVDLAAERQLLRLRRRVEPSWISEQKRPHFARGLDGCRLAFDVRQELAAARGE